MIQQDKDRETLKAWLKSRDKWPTDMDWQSVLGSIWISGATEGWQACADHYAPKLTEKEAVKIMADAIYKDCFPSGCGDDLEYDAFSKDAKVGIASIRAAGMRFKEVA
jgi:hypothetical protein